MRELYAAAEKMLCSMRRYITWDGVVQLNHDVDILRTVAFLLWRGFKNSSVELYYYYYYYYYYYIIIIIIIIFFFIIIIINQNSVIINTGEYTP